MDLQKLAEYAYHVTIHNNNYHLHSYSHSTISREYYMALHRSLPLTSSNAIFQRGRLALTITAALSAYAFQATAAETSTNTAKGNTIVVTGNSTTNVVPESAWGPSPTIAAKHSATGTKTDTLIGSSAL